jgi:DNA-damage-inducible protein J
MAQTNISIRIDEDIKKDAETLFAKLGLTLSSATNVFYRQAVRTQGIPFPLVVTDNEPSKKTKTALKEAIRIAQEQSVINGTDNMTMDEINAIIAEGRQETSSEE